MPSDAIVFLILDINPFFVLCITSGQFMKTVSSYEHTGSKEHPAGRFSSRIGTSPGHTTREQCVVQVSFPDGKEASFKVDFRKELWYDFGLGKGGDIITLAKEIYRTGDISHVLRCIEDKRAVLKPVTISCPVEEAAPAFQELKIRPLANRILLAYLKERCIDVETAGKICREASFKRNGKIILPLPFPIFPVGMRYGTDF